MFGNNKIKIVAFILAFLFFPSPASMGGTASYIHDAHLNRLIRVKYVTGGTTQVLYYTYDAAGNRTALTPGPRPSGSQVVRIPGLTGI